MILKSDLQYIIDTQIESLETDELLCSRSIQSEVNPFVPFALVLSGIRRCGKSTLLYQLLKKYGSPNYLNLEDPRLINFDLADFERVEDIFANHSGEAVFFFDEIQNIEKWELYIRRLVDRKKPVVLTGSNSSLLSRELGSRLTGRHLRYELFPLSYMEFLDLTGTLSGLESFERYMNAGGFPEYIKSGNIQILQQLLIDILNRDIAVRNGIRNVKQLHELIIYLLSNTGKPFSLSNLQKSFQYGSVNTVKDFISYFEDSYLIFTIPRFSYSLRVQAINPKKVYAIDTGLLKANTIQFSDDRGRMLENLVFLHVRRKSQSIYYFKEKHECDFVVFEKNSPSRVIQVCYELNDGNFDREIEGCKQAIQHFKLNAGTVVTFQQEDNLVIGDTEIQIVPAWKWFSKD